MTIKALRKLLHQICDNGYGDWIVNFCDDDDDDYTVNYIYTDNDGDICLESTDAYETDGSYTAKGILRKLKRYNGDKYVYFLEEYWDESSCAYDIVFNWYIGTDYYGDDILNIDCEEMDDDEWGW